jgi:hypothetical protein
MLAWPAGVRAGDAREAGRRRNRQRLQHPPGRSEFSLHRLSPFGLIRLFASGSRDHQAQPLRQQWKSEMRVSSV